MNKLDEARTHLSAYKKLGESSAALKHLNLGIAALCDILEEEYPPEEKDIARNMALSYRHNTVEKIQTKLPAQSKSIAEIQTLDYCRLLMDCFNDIDEYVGSDSEFRLLEDSIKKQLERVTETEAPEITDKNVVGQILSLPEDRHERMIEFLEKCGIPKIRHKVKKEKVKRAKMLTAIKDQQDNCVTYQERDAHVGASHNARAEMVIRAGLYIILKDSTAMKEDKPSLPEGARREKGSLIASGALVPDNKQGNLLRFTRDVPFRSASAASCVISGCSTNGVKYFGIDHG